MSAAVQEWLNLIVRWIHVIAGIMWIGDSFLFMWLDSHLTGPLRKRAGDVVGELWMTHSGGFYEVIKRKSLARDELPPTLYWFKWESYTTWMSGFLLLIIVYELNGAALLIDPKVRALSPGMAVHLSLLSLPLAYGLYELLWKTPLARHGRAFAVVGLALLVGAAYGFTHLYSGRGAFLQMGAVMGTIMAANVFFRIIPAQRHMLAATRAGTHVDTSYGARAKGRSIQNHYLTLPVLFTMLSNHFPSTYGSGKPWLVLACLLIFGVGLKYFMNFRGKTPPLFLAGTVAALVGAVALAWPVSPADAARAQLAGQPRVPFAAVSAILQTRCASCHTAHPVMPMFAGPPEGVVLDTPDGIAAHAGRVFLRAVATQTMPLGNLTGMTAEERRLVGAWFVQGADVHAVGAPAGVADRAQPSPLQTPVLEPPASPDGPLSIPVPAFRVETSPELIASGKAAFAAKGCVACHRVGGGKLVGPDLKGVTARRSVTWIERMILRPDLMVQEDAVAKALLAAHLTPMPNQHVDPQTELKALLAYLKSEEQ